MSAPKQPAAVMRKPASPKPASKPASSRSNKPNVNKVRVRLRSYDFRLLDKACDLILEVLKDTASDIAGPIPLPTRKRRYCVNSSTHVDKRSGEHFEIRVHTRIIEIIDPAEDTMSIFQKVDLPAGVGVNVQVISR